MRTGISILGSLAIAVAAFVCGLAVSELTGLGRTDGLVKVKNSTAWPLRVAEVVIDSCGQHTWTSIADVPDGGEVELRFAICGEGGQVVRATLGNGKRVLSRETYVESGARSSAEVTDNEVRM